jgi:tetratricopeptide (TPR) repeat protein
MRGRKLDTQDGQSGGAAGNFFAAAFISVIAASAVWWFGPEYFTELDEVGWYVAAGGVGVVLLLLFLAADRLLSINVAFEILRGPYRLLALPFKALLLIDKKFEEPRKRIADNGAAGLVVGTAFWTLAVWIAFHQLVPSPEPCRASRPCILIVGLQGDDVYAAKTGFVRWSLDSAFAAAGIGKTANVVVVPRPLFRVVANEAGSVRWEAKYWLNKLGGDVLIYGAAPRHGAVMRLNVYALHADESETQARLVFPHNYGSDYATSLALIAAVYAKPARDDGYAGAVLWPLAKRLVPFVAALPLMPATTASAILSAEAEAARAAGEAGNDEALKLAINTYTAVLNSRFGSHIAVQAALAETLDTLGFRENGAAKFEEAKRIYAEAVIESNEGAERLSQAAESYRDILKTIDKAKRPQQWAALQFKLARVLEETGDRKSDYNSKEDGSLILNDAVVAYREALTVSMPPQDWARTQFQLGRTLETIAKHTGDATKYPEAVEAYRRALYVYAGDETPVLRADAKFRLGSALLQMAKANHDVAKMQEAAEALREALKIYGTNHVANGNSQSAIVALGEAEAEIVKTVAPPQPSGAAPAAPVAQTLVPAAKPHE